jgi:mono/diheme cytochrome c family protein
MSWNRWASVLLASAALASAIVALSCTTGRQSTAMSAADMLARGKELSYSMGCQDCHTPGGMYGSPDTSRQLSGSELGWVGPWGTTYPRNLTPDPETGIGSWSEDDIIRAFRTGQRPDGTPILPPMPWPGFAHASDEDAHALASYIKNLPPVDHKVPDRLPPGAKPAGAVLVMPPPPAWDAPRGAPEGGGMPDTAAADTARRP